MTKRGPRYTKHCQLEAGTRGGMYYGIMDNLTGKIVMHCGVLYPNSDGDYDWMDVASWEDGVVDDMYKHYPRHRDPEAYWPGDKIKDDWSTEHDDGYESFYRYKLEG